MNANYDFCGWRSCEGKGTEIRDKEADVGRRPGHVSRRGREMLSSGAREAKGKIDPRVTLIKRERETFKEA